MHGSIWQQRTVVQFKILLSFNKSFNNLLELPMAIIRMYRGQSCLCQPVALMLVLPNFLLIYDWLYCPSVILPSQRITQWLSNHELPDQTSYYSLVINIKYFDNSDSGDGLLLFQTKHRIIVIITAQVVIFALCSTKGRLIEKKQNYWNFPFIIKKKHGLMML